MTNTGRVHRREGSSEWLENLDCLCSAEGLPLEARLERLAVVPGHDEPEALLEPAVVFELHDGRVEHRSDQTKFSERRLLGALRVSRLVKELEGHDMAGHLGVFCSIHVPKRAKPDAGFDRVPPTDDGSARQWLYRFAFFATTTRCRLECECFDDDACEAVFICHALLVENRCGVRLRLVYTLVHLRARRAVHEREFLDA